jgi:hypothetical protein
MLSHWFDNKVTADEIMYAILAVVITTARIAYIISSAVTLLSNQ